MQSPAFTNSQVPDSLKGSLNNISYKLVQVSEKDIGAIILYGGIARKEFEMESSDINMMIVLKNPDIDLLHKIGPVIESISLNDNISPFVMSEQELFTSYNYFPIKFLDAKKNHLVLFGKDYLEDLEIKENHLKENCQRELKNILLRLNQIYIRHFRYPEALENRLKPLITSLLINVNILLYLKTNVYYDTKAKIVEAGIKEFELDPCLFAELLGMKKGNRLKGSDIYKVYNRFMQTTDLISSLADKI